MQQSRTLAQATALWSQLLLSGDHSQWLALTQTDAKVTVALMIFLVMCTGGFFLARGMVRVGTSVLGDVLQSAPAVDRRGDGWRDLMLAAAIIGGSFVLDLVIFALW